MACRFTGHVDTEHSTKSIVVVDYGTGAAATVADIVVV